jgi:type II secretory ATPase GspE/PulE/Tfp pilus assembly ATPase PilB-like protein
MGDRDRKQHFRRGGGKAPGTGNYVARDLFWYRSTLAHNAPQLDGRSQSPGDAICECFEVRGQWAWVRARFGTVTRSLVVIRVNQVAARPDIGLDFASALRSILRQDPDIVMVGEIRDNETADIAVKAALTGHQVLSTLHTNDAAGAITRLDDMGIEPFLISSSILMTCAQRLVRKICTNCREEFMPEPEIFTRLEVEPKAETVFYRGSGCDRCKGRGYLGRLAIIEALTVTEAVRRLIMKRASAAVIKNQAVAEGMKTLRMAGIDKALEGQTTLEEVLRVAADDH